MTLCPAAEARFALTRFQVLVFVQVGASRVVVLPVTVSRRVAVAQSYRTESGQWTWYQKLSVPPLAGTVKVWLIELSPFVTAVEPPRPASRPAWTGAVTIPVVPRRVQPARTPVSKPPLITTPAGAGVAAGVGVGDGAGRR